MKTKEELNALKEEVETLNKKLAELTDEELAEVTGGTKFSTSFDRPDNSNQYEIHIYTEPETKDFKPNFDK